MDIIHDSVYHNYSTSNYLCTALSVAVWLVLYSRVEVNLAPVLQFYRFRDMPTT